MTTFEIILIVSACLIPVISLFLLLPKFKRRHLIPMETTEYISESKENTKEETPKTEEPKEERPLEVKSSSTDEFKDYLEYKKNNVSHPNRIVRSDIEDNTTPYILRNSSVSNNKNISEQINEISPELMALIFSGAFDRKYFN